jgi:hypothetical protein
MMNARLTFRFDSALAAPRTMSSLRLHHHLKECKNEGGRQVGGFEFNQDPGGAMIWPLKKRVMQATYRQDFAEQSCLHCIRDSR